jgi:hypothetical protein
MKMFPIAPGLALALASATAHAQTTVSAGCPQKAADGGNNPQLPQQAAAAAPCKG